MKKTVLFLTLSLLWSLKASMGGVTHEMQVDTVNEISNQFRSGDIKGLSKYLSSSVILSLRNNENVYSKAQSEIILERFFKENSPQSSKVIHRLDNNANYLHAVLLLNTENGDYRVSISLKGVDQLQLTEVRIEKSN